MTMLLVEMFVLVVAAFLTGCGAAATVVHRRLRAGTAAVPSATDRVTP